MRTIEWTSAFKRDYKRIKATPRHRDIETLLPEIASRLANNRHFLKDIAITLLVATGRTIGSAISNPICC